MCRVDIEHRESKSSVWKGNGNRKRDLQVTGLSINENKTENGTGASRSGSCTVKQCGQTGFSSTNSVGNWEAQKAHSQQMPRTDAPQRFLLEVLYSNPFLGLLIFASQVISTSRLYLRSGYALVNAVPDNRWRVMVTISTAFRQDCAWWRKLMWKSEYCGMHLDKWAVSGRWLCGLGCLHWGYTWFLQKWAVFQSHGQNATILEWELVS